MAKRVATQRRPWHYTECGLDNVYLAGIEVETDPTTGEEEPIIPELEDLHDCIFISLVSKPGPLTGREVRYLRRHLLWTQAGASERFGFNSAQYLCELERKRERFSDIATDFLCRFECLNAFIRQARGLRKREAKGILHALENTLEKIRKKPERKPRMITIRRLTTSPTRFWRPWFAAA